MAEALYQNFKQVFVSQWQIQHEPFEVMIDITDFLIDNRNVLDQLALRQAEEEELKEWELVEEVYQILDPTVQSIVCQPSRPKWENYY